MLKSVEALATGPTRQQVVERLSQLGSIDINTHVRLLNPDHNQTTPPDRCLMPAADESTESQYGRLTNFVLSRPVQVGARAATIAGALVGTGILVDVMSDNDNAKAYAANLEAPQDQQPPLSPAHVIQTATRTATALPTITPEPTATHRPTRTARPTRTPKPTETTIPTATATQPLPPTQPPAVFVTPGVTQQTISVCETDPRGVLTGFIRIREFVSGILQRDQRFPARECQPQQVAVPVERRVPVDRPIDRPVSVEVTRQVLIPGPAQPAQQPAAQAPRQEQRQEQRTGDVTQRLDISVNLEGLPVAPAVPAPKPVLARPTRGPQELDKAPEKGEPDDTARNILLASLTGLTVTGGIIALVKRGMKFSDPQ